MTQLDILTELSKGDYEAFLYDCDGTLADNMQAHKDTYVKVAADHGIEIDDAIIDEFAGLPIPRVIEEINKRYNCDFDPQTFEKLKYDLYYNEYIQHIKPVQHVADHLLAHAEKLKIGVVSGGSPEAIRKTLVAMATMALLHWCNTVCRSAGSVVRKPLAIGVCRCGAYLLVSAGPDAWR